MAETERERLRRRLFDAGARNVHVDWTDEGLALSHEERAGVLNRALDAIEAGDYEELPDEELDG